MSLERSPGGRAQQFHEEPRMPQVAFPYAKALIDQYAQVEDPGKREKASPKAVETMRQVTKVISKHILGGADRYKSRAFEDVKLPYTRVSLKKVAEEIFGIERLQEIRAKKSPLSTKQCQPKNKKEFVFSGAPKSIQIGGPFDWPMTAAVHAAALRFLPQALTSLARGEEIGDYEIYCVGWPTSPYGHVSDDYIQAIQEKGFAGFGKVHDEFIRKEIAPKEDSTRPVDTVMLTGLSFGSSVAAEVGKSLLEDKKVIQGADVKKKYVKDTPQVQNVPSPLPQTPQVSSPMLSLTASPVSISSAPIVSSPQSMPKEATPPRLFITMYTPAGVREDDEWTIRRWPQISIGLAVEAIRSRIINPIFRFMVSPANNPNTMVEQALRAAGNTAMTLDPSNDDLKNKCRRICLATVLDGAAIPEGLDAKMVVGGRDLLMYSPERNGNLRDRKNVINAMEVEDREKYFVERMQERNGGNDPTQASTFFAPKMPHQFFAAFRKSDFNRCDAVVKAIEQIAP